MAMTTQVAPIASTWGISPQVRRSVARFVLEVRHDLEDDFRRQLAAFPRDVLERGLAALAGEGRLTAYAPLAERSGRRVAQAEHTVYLGPEGVEVLTG